jgi:HEAT repeat protein
MTASDAQIGIFTVDARLVVSVWDDTLARTTGIAPDAARGRPLAELVPDLEAGGLLERFKRVLEVGTVEVLVPAFHRYLVRCAPPFPSKYFDAMQQRVTIAPLRVGERIEGAVVTIQDVTARLERERELAAQLASPDEAERLRAAEALRDVEPSDSATALVNALRDTSWRVRRAATGGLAKQVAPDAVAALLRAMREGHQDFGLVNSALAVLRVLDVDVVAPLAEFLESGDVGLSVQAALALGEQRDKRAIPPLVRALDGDDPNVRYHAIEALGKHRAAEAAPALAAIAESGDFFLAFAALDALSAIADPAAAPRLVPLLEDEMLGAQAAEALGKLGDPLAVGPLAAALSEGRVPAATVARAFAAMHDRAGPVGEARVEGAVRDSIDDAGARLLVEALEDAPGDDLPALARVVAWLEDEAADRALVGLLDRAAVRDLAVEALVRRGPPVAGMLVERLSAEDREVRRAAATALGRVPDASAAPALIRMLSEDPGLESVAAGALARTGDPRALDPLLGLLGHEDAAARQAAVNALQALGHPDTASRAVELLGDPDPHARESAVRVLGAVGGRAHAGRLFESCRDPDERVRCAAVEQISRLDDRRVVPELSRILQSDERRVRAAAAHALGRVRGGGTAGLLLAALRDPDSWVRYFAARSVAALDLAEGAGELVRLARQDPAVHVRISAMEGLGRVGGSEATALLAEQAGTADPDVARAARTALEEIAARTGRGPENLTGAGGE